MGDVVEIQRLLRCQKKTVEQTCRQWKDAVPYRPLLQTEGASRLSPPLMQAAAYPRRSDPCVSQSTGSCPTCRLLCLCPCLPW
jgi:hypothetical protein